MAESRPRRWDPIWRVRIRPARVAVVLAALTILFLATWPALMTAYARWFMVSDPPVHADVAVVLAGGEGERLYKALLLWRERRVPALLLTGPSSPYPLVYTGQQGMSQGEIKRRIAIQEGVPADQVWLALGAESTWAEAHDARRYLEAHALKSAIVVTSPYHSRRARATFRHVFRGSGIRVTLETLPPESSTEHCERWWTREWDALAVYTETIKTVFYWVRYGVSPV